MKRIGSQILLIAVAWVVCFGFPDVGVALPDWVAQIINIDPGPIKLDGFRAYIFEETSERHNLKPGQLEAIGSNLAGGVADYAKTHAVKTDGVPEWRVLDPNDNGQPRDFSLDSPGVQEAAKLPKASLPWLVVSNYPHGGYSGPLPETAAETLAILKKYGD